GMASCDGVEPSAATGASGSRSEFAAHGMKHVSDFGVLGRQGAFADARGVSFHHADYSIHAVWSHARASASAAGSGIGRGNEWIGAVIDVQKGALGAFK